MDSLSTSGQGWPLELPRPEALIGPVTQAAYGRGGPSRDAERDRDRDLLQVSEKDCMYEGEEGTGLILQGRSREKAQREKTQLYREEFRHQAASTLQRNETL